MKTFTITDNSGCYDSETFTTSETNPHAILVEGIEIMYGCKMSEVDDDTNTSMFQDCTLQEN